MGEAQVLNTTIDSHMTQTLSDRQAHMKLGEHSVFKVNKP